MEKNTRLYTSFGVHIASYYVVLHLGAGENIKYLKHD